MCLERNLVCTVSAAALGHLVLITPLRARARVVRTEEVGKGGDSEYPSAHQEANGNGDAAGGVLSMRTCVGIAPFGLQSRALRVIDGRWNIIRNMLFLVHRSTNVVRMCWRKRGDVRRFSSATRQLYSQIPANTNSASSILKKERVFEVTDPPSKSSLLYCNTTTVIEVHMM